MDPRNHFETTSLSCRRSLKHVSLLAYFRTSFRCNKLGSWYIQDEYRWVISTYPFLTQNMANPQRKGVFSKPSIYRCIQVLSFRVVIWFFLPLSPRWVIFRSVSTSCSLGRFVFRIFKRSSTCGVNTNYRNPFWWIMTICLQMTMNRFS